MKPPAKILFIGVDAADKDLIQTWAGAGLLSTFKRLMETGAWGISSTPEGLYVGAVWPSFYTGVSPATHTRYCYRQLIPGSYEFASYEASEVKTEPFWEPLSRAKKKVAIIDCPKCVQSKDINGIHIVDWGSHDPEKIGFSAWPSSLESELREQFEGNELASCDAFRETAAEFQQLTDKLISRIETKRKLSSHYLNQGGWDLFLTVFSESHCVGHQCWHLHDPTHPRHNPEVAAVVGDPMLKIYQALDSAVGELLEQAGPDTTAFVMASHGIDPHYDATFLLDQMLLGLESHQGGQKAFKKIRSSRHEFVDSILQGVSDPNGVKNYPKAAKAIRWIRDKLPPGVGIRRMIRRFREDRTHKRMSQEVESRKSRKYFQIPNNDAYGAIRVNLAGREPNGMVRPGTEYEDLCRALTRDMMSFTNVKTGEPLVRRVLRTADLYEGKHMNHLPDLMVEWSRSAPISVISSPKTGELRGEYTQCRTGDHKGEGIFFVSGKSIEPGPIGRPVSIMDFSSTVASMLGVELPDVEGKSFAPLIGLK